MLKKSVFSMVMVLIGSVSSGVSAAGSPLSGRIVDGKGKDATETVVSRNPDERHFKNLLNIDPFESIHGRIECNYEREIKEKHSIGLVPTIGGLHLEDEWHIRVDFTYNYCTKATFRGFWFSPRISVFHAVYHPGAGKRKQVLNTIEPALGVGYRWIFGRRLYAGVGGGIGPSIELCRDELMDDRRAYLFAITDIGFVF